MKPRWKLREIVVSAVLAVVFGFVFVGADALWGVVNAIGGPLLTDAIFGLWFVGGTGVAFIMRRPGAALFGEVLGAIVEMLAGGPIGLRLIIVGLIQGAGAEAVYVLTRYRRWDLTVNALAGVGASAFSWVWTLVGPSAFFKFSAGFLVADFVIRGVSGAVLGGILPALLGVALSRTGVLSGFAIDLDRRRLLAR